jgi:hypothetical protein
MTTVAIPPPPAGPGVQPPFVAPPTDGSRRRRWIGVGIAAGVLVLLCAGGAGLFVALIGLSAQATREEAGRSVTAYLSDLRDGQFGRAWTRLCPALKQRVSSAEFTREQQALPRITQFSLGDVTISPDILVPATITRTDSSSEHVTFVMALNQQSAQYEVCGQTG